MAVLTGLVTLAQVNAGKNGNPAWAQAEIEGFPLAVDLGQVEQLRGFLRQRVTVEGPITADFRGQRRLTVVTCVAGNGAVPPPRDKPL